MAEVSLDIAGRSYRVACRDGEEENLREALAGLGTLSESRQLLFASLLIADQMLEKPGMAPQMQDIDLAPRINALADRIEKLAERLEGAAQDA
jgi:cell division protein ZapA